MNEWNESDEWGEGGGGRSFPPLLVWPLPPTTYSDHLLNPSHRTDHTHSLSFNSKMFFYAKINNFLNWAKSAFSYILCLNFVFFVGFELFLKIGMYRAHHFFYPFIVNFISCREWELALISSVFCTYLSPFVSE